MHQHLSISSIYFLEINIKAKAIKLSDGLKIRKRVKTKGNGSMNEQFHRI